MYNYSKLRGRIIEKCGSVSAFAQIIDLSLTSVSNKLNNHAGFSREDIEKWGSVLEIEPVQYAEYFFCKLSSTN